VGVQVYSNNMQAWAARIFVILRIVENCEINYKILVIVFTEIDGKTGLRWRTWHF
jgi:hypothetical protein